MWSCGPCQHLWGRVSGPDAAKQSVETERKHVARQLIIQIRRIDKDL
jgi:hypothetical protein